MKKICAFAASLALLLCALSYAQESGEKPLSIAIVGVKNYNDVNLMIKNLKRSQQIKDLTVSLSSRELTELSGNYQGSQESLMEEIAGLAQDRFEVELSKKSRKADAPLAITLRKIKAESTP